MLLIAVAVFMLVLLGGLTALYYGRLQEQKRKIVERIRAAMRPGEQGEEEEQGWKSSVRRFVVRLGEKFRPQKESGVSKTRVRLMRAGFYGEKAVIQLFGSKVALALALPALFLAAKLFVLQPMPAQKILAFLFAASAAGFFLPDYYVYRKTKVRKQKIFEAFPDALDLMVVCSEAGMGLDSAIKRVGDEMAVRSPFLSEELRLLSLELRAGKSRIEALRNLSLRTDIEDVASLVTLLIQTDKFGTRVAQALRVYSDSMRTKRYQRAEEIAAKMSVKILFPLVMFIMPATILTLVGPGVIKFYRVMSQGNMRW